MLKDHDDIWLRYHCNADLAQMAAIDAVCSPYPWCEAMLRLELRQRRAICRVIDIGNSYIRPILAGFMVYRLKPLEIELERFAIDPDWQRLGLGTRLMARLQSRLSERSRLRRIVATVPESCLSMSLFLRSQGFRAVGVLRGEFGDEDGISFVWSRGDCCGR